ncbi:MAG: GNAT family N-acetyltransferase [Thaumarchaeota archaeon]|nr:GNAT family N-acetyltransferase [Nitrososphaerota archaeon]
MTARPRRESRAGRGIAVRDARRADLPALLDIYNDAVLASPATFDLEPLTLAQRRRWFSEHGRLHPLVVAESDQRVVGYASLSPFRDKPGYSKSAEDSVYVHKDFQGRGVGTMLMKEILARAVNLGYHTIVAGIVPPNEASVRLHEGLGFAYVGNFKEVGFKFLRWQDVAFYQLFLPARK